MIKWNPYPVLVSAVLLILWIGGCRNEEALQGKYQAEFREGTSTSIIKLDLGANGQGGWTLKDEKVFFKWESQGKEVWLHTKSGGVVTGRLLEPGVIEVDMPGAGRFSFKKMAR